MLLDLLVQLDRLDQNWCYRNIQSGATAACLLNASGSLGNRGIDDLKFYAGLPLWFFHILLMLRI